MNYKAVTIIGLTGLPSSGKGEFSKIAEQMGFVKVIMGDVIRQEIEKEGLPVNRANANKIMIKLRDEKGEDVVAKITMGWIKNEIEKNYNKILIDGIRSMAEVKIFRKEFPNLILIAIHADPKTRFLRSTTRKRKDDAYSYETFKKRDEIELGVGIGDVIALSDILVESKYELKEMRQIYMTILNELTPQYKIGVVKNN